MTGYASVKEFELPLNLNAMLITLNKHIAANARKNKGGVAQTIQVMIVRSWRPLHSPSR